MRTLRTIPAVSTIAELLDLINERFRTFNSAGDTEAFSGDMAGGRLTNVGVPTENTDAATAGWVGSRFAKKGEGGGIGPPGPPGIAGPVTLTKNSIAYSGAISRSVDDLLGEIPSFRSFGAVGDGVANDQPAMQAAVNEIASRGGGIILIPGGYTFKLNSYLAVPSDVHIVGQGETSILLRGAAMAAGRGLLDVSGSRNVLQGFKIEGNVTTSAALNYSTFSDPTDAVLTLDTSIWLHDGVANVVIEDVLVTHTGGYAVYLEHEVTDVVIENCKFANNRPHTFGVTAGSLFYGSWTGGIFARGNGTTKSSSRVRIIGCDFRRGTGNQIWQHLTAFGKLHSDWIIDDCQFLDIGRDCVLLGGMVNAVVSNCTARRIGYICSADTGAGTPRWLADAWAVAFDTSGMAVNCVYSNCAVLNCIGGAFDLDGFSQGVINGNAGRVSKVGEPEYTEDAVASWTNGCYGINLGDTSNNIGGLGVQVTANFFDNMIYGAIRLYGWQSGLCALNTIIHPAAPTIAPITFGPGGAGANQGCGNCVVTGNTIFYAPAAAAPAIYEDATLAAFTTANHVFLNRIIGANAYEFQPHSSSGSKTSLILSTSTAGATTKDEMQIQVEGTGAGKALKIYAVAAAAAQVLQLTKAGFLNISDNGAALTGNVATGNRTTAAWADAVVTGKGYFDAFAALKQYTSGGTFSSADADALDNTHALLRYNPAIPDVEKSVMTLAGARVWSPVGLSVGSGPSVPGANTEVIFNDSGAFGADAGLTYVKATNVLTVAGSAAIAGVVLGAGYMQSSEGFLTNSASANAFQALSGGVTALSHIAARNDGASGFTLARSSATARTWGFGIDAAGQLFVRDETAAANRLTFDTATGRATFAAQVVVGGAASGSGLLVSDGYVESAEGFYSPMTSYQASQNPAGGMYARSFRAIAYSQLGSNFGVPSLTAGDSFQPGATYYNSASGRIEFFNGSIWQVLDVAGASGVTSVSSFSGNLTASPTTGAVVLTPSLNPTFQTVSVTGGGTALNLFSGYGVSASGWQTSSFAQNAIQAYQGGVLANSGFFIGNQFAWNTAIDPSRNFFGLAYKTTAGVDLINSSGIFVGPGTNVGPFFSTSAGSFNQVGFFGTNAGRTVTISLIDAFGNPQVLIFRGGILTTT